MESRKVVLMNLFQDKKRDADIVSRHADTGTGDAGVGWIWRFALTYIHYLPGSSVHGIFQARVLECIAIPFSRGSSQPRDQTQVSRIAGRLFIV